MDVEGDEGNMIDGLYDVVAVRGPTLLRVELHPFDLSAESMETLTLPENRDANGRRGTEFRKR